MSNSLPGYKLKLFANIIIMHFTWLTSESQRMVGVAFTLAQFTVSELDWRWLTDLLLETSGLILTSSRPKRSFVDTGAMFTPLEEYTKVHAGPHPTRNDRPMVRPVSAIRLCFPTVTDWERGTSTGWVRIPAAFKADSEGLPTTLGSKIGCGRLYHCELMR